MAALSKEEIREVQQVFDLESDNLLNAILVELQAIRLLNEHQSKLLRLTVLALIALSGVNVVGRFFI